MPEKLFIGVEIGGTKLQAAVGIASGKIVRSAEAPADAVGGASAILRQLEELVGTLLGEEEAPIAAIGIGYGGPVDAMRGLVIKSNHVAGWENISLVDWATDAFQLPCVIGNDTDVAALAEARVGAGKSDRCVFYTNIGSGIGGGLVVDGQLYARPRGAMEVGHSRVYSELDQKHGILEDFCSGWSLNRRAQAAADRDKSSLLWSLSRGGLEGISAATLFDAWAQRDEAATQVVECFLDCYGRTMANVIAMLNPDVLVIGGGVAQRGMPLLEAIRRRTSQFVYEPFADSYRIELTALGKDVVPVGALLIAAAVEA